MLQADSWKELLKQLTILPAARQAGAERMNVNPITLQRWVQGISKPSMQNLIELPNAFPEYREQFIALIEHEYGIRLPASEEMLAPVPTLEPNIPSEYLLKILSEHARAGGAYATWYLRSYGLEQLLTLLDPGKEGMDISIIRCIPPAEGGLVRSLCEIMGAANPPWPSGIGRRLLFLGAESLAGWVVEHGEPGVIQDLSDSGFLPFRRTAFEKSAAAYPIQRGGRIGGCLMASCCFEQAWTPLRLYYLESFSYALALPFEETEFYEGSQISLRALLPRSEEHAKTLQQQFQDRILRLRRQYDSLTVAQAETLALQQIETTLLQESE